jgi:hypothetical protein
MLDMPRDQLTTLMIGDLGVDLMCEVMDGMKQKATR